MAFSHLACGALFMAITIGFQPKSGAPELPLIEKRLNKELIAEFPSARLALSHKTELTKQERIEALNNRILSELDSVLLDINRSSSSELIESLLSHIRVSVDRQLARLGYGAQYQGGQSVLTIERQLVFIRLKSSEVKDAARQVISIISSYERTAQPGEELEEYPDAKDLRAGKTRRSVGSENFMVYAQPALTAAEPVAIRKCRKFTDRLEGMTVCSTSLYDVQAFGDGSGAEALIEVGLNPLSKTDLSKYKIMVPDGLTSLYLAEQFEDLVFIYKVGLRYSEVPWPDLDERALSASLIEEAYRRLLARIEFDIKQRKLPWEIVRWQQASQ